MIQNDVNFVIHHEYLCFRYFILKWKQASGLHCIYDDENYVKYMYVQI